MTEQVQLTIISTIGGIIIAYIVNVAAKKVQSNREKKQPKDRMEQMFDGYERLIKQKDTEDDRKVRAIQALEDELVLTRKTVTRLKKELEKSREENQELRDLLNEMRKEYGASKDGTKST